jgi:hypothetical protein
MPHVRCHRSNAFSVARWSNGGWDAELPPVARDAGWRPPPDVESEVREHLYGAPGRRAAVDRIDRAARRD